MSETNANATVKSVVEGTDVPRDYKPEEILEMLKVDPELKSLDTTWNEPYAEDFRLLAITGKAIEKLGYDNVAINEELGLRYDAAYLDAFEEKIPGGFEMEDLDEHIVARSIPSLSDIIRATDDADDCNLLLQRADWIETEVRDGAELFVADGVPHYQKA